MFLFGLSNAVAAGSKLTTYQTSHNTTRNTLRGTSRGTSRSTSRGTNWTTSRGTSRTTTWTTTWTSGWNTTYNTSLSYYTLSEAGKTYWYTSRLTSQDTTKDTGKPTYHLTEKITTYSTYYPRMSLGNWNYNKYYTNYNLITYYVFVDGNAGTDANGVSHISRSGYANSGIVGNGYAAVNNYMAKGKQHGCKWAILAATGPTTVRLNAADHNYFQAGTGNSDNNVQSAMAGELLYYEYTNLPHIHSRTRVGTSTSTSYYFEDMEHTAPEKWDIYPYASSPSMQLYGEANSFNLKSPVFHMFLRSTKNLGYWSGLQKVAFGIKHPPAGGFTNLNSERFYYNTVLSAPDIGIKGGRRTDYSDHRRYEWSGRYGEVMTFPRINGSYDSDGLSYGKYNPAINTASDWSHPFWGMYFGCSSMQNYRDTSNQPYQMMASAESRFRVVQVAFNGKTYIAFRTSLPFATNIPSHDMLFQAQKAYPANAIYATYWDTSRPYNAFTNYNSLIQTTYTTQWGTGFQTSKSTTKTTTFTTSHPTTATAQTSSSTSGGTSWTTYWNTSRTTTFTTSWTTSWNTTVSTVYSTLYNTSHITVG